MSIATTMPCNWSSKTINMQLHYNYPIKIRGINKKNFMSKNQKVVLYLRWLQNKHLYGRMYALYI
jgi:hypothetical protein